MFRVLCWADNQRCEVTEAASRALSAEMHAGAEAALPCEWCRGAEKYVRQLAGLRLGRHERRLLAEAPSPTGEPAAITYDGETRAALEAQRRAVRSLWNAGLVWRQQRAVRTEGRTCRRLAVQRSPLGQAVVERLGPVLLTRTRIRWARLLPLFITDVRRPTAKLVAQWEQAMAKLA